MQPTWRLLDSGLVDSAQSAALDEAILEAHIAHAVPNTLHFYVRTTPTISIGYFQKASESLDLEECARRGIQLVRRKSGGSSIYTDSGQLIYGLVVSESDVPRERPQSFRFICSALARAISSFGVDARYREMNDVEIAGRKVSGNAQLRRKGSLLQHGTIILDTDLSAMDAVLRMKESKRHSISTPSDRIVTLASLIGRAPSMTEMKRRISLELARDFEIKFVESSLTPLENRLVHKLVDDRYSKRDWNLKF